MEVSDHLAVRRCEIVRMWLRQVRRLSTGKLDSLGWPSTSQLRPASSAPAAIRLDRSYQL